MKKPHKGYTPTPEHRAKILENLRKAWAVPRAGPRTPRQEAANRANLAKAHAAMRARGWPHSERQLAAARANLKKAREALRAHGHPSTPRTRAASRVNLAKANAALRAKGYPHSARQRAAASRNIRQAWLVSHDPANYARIHAIRLKHGLQARAFERTFEPLGESPAEYERLRASLEGAFVPQDDLERKILRRLAETVWRRLRLYAAEARWETDALNALLDGPPMPRRDLNGMHEYALNLMDAVTLTYRYFTECDRIVRDAKRLCRALLLHRSRGKVGFFRVRRTREEREFEPEEKTLREHSGEADSPAPSP